MIVKFLSSIDVLRIHDQAIILSNAKLVALAVGIAESRITKAQVAAILRQK